MTVSDARGTWKGRTYDTGEPFEESQRREEDAGTDEKLHCCALVIWKDLRTIRTLERPLL